MECESGVKILVKLYKTTVSEQQMALISFILLYTIEKIDDPNIVKDIIPLFSCVVSNMPQLS